MTKRVKLGDISDLSIGFVGTVTTQYEDGGIPFFRTLNIKPYWISDVDLKRVSKNFHVKQRKSQLRTGDIAMVHTGIPGICCVIPEEYDDSNCIDMIVIKPHREVLDPYFLESYMNTVGYKHIEKQQVGCIQKHFNLKDAQDLEIYLPNIMVQRKIGLLNYAINKIIQNNYKINTVLESMAKTIYDYWFLQFEFPDEEGKPYKSSGGKMVWNEELKREIPEGWEVKELRDIVDITMGTSPKGNTININGDGIVFYQGKADFGSRFPIMRTYTREPIRYAEKNDVLLSVRAPVGALNIADKRCCIGRGLAAIHSEYTSFVFYFLLASQFRFDIYNNGGTTFGAITRDDLFKMRMLISPKNIIKKFEEKVNYIDRKISNNSNEIKELISLRDYLLPLLMNGQIRFKT